MQKNHGFTLVELLVVVAIIGILAGIVAPKLFRAMDSAKEQQCRNNLKQLQTAVIDYAIEHDKNMPNAAGFEYWGSGISNGKNGWISWVPSSPDQLLDWFGDFGGATQEPKFSDDLGIGDPKNDGYPALWAIRNGTLWNYVKNEKCYYCPVTRGIKRTWMELSDENPDDSSGNRTDWQVYRSYAMNSFFGGPYNRRAWAADACRLTYIGVNLYTDSGNPMGWINSDSTADRFRHIPQPSRLLLFSEVIPNRRGVALNARTGSRGGAKDLSINPHDGAISVKSASAISLETKGLRWQDGKNISFGFPKDDKKADMVCGLHDPIIWYEPAKTYLGSALAVFVDGHIEKIFPVYESSDGTAALPLNSAWFYCHGIRPAETVPKN